MTVGEYLKELRQAKGISQKELSGLTGGEVSNAEISRLEAGIRKKPSPAILKILAPHLGVPVSMLLSRAGYMDDGPTEGVSAADTVRSAQKPDRQFMQRLEILEEERSALRKSNQELREEANAARARLQQAEAAGQQWEDKYNTLLKQAPSGSRESSAVELENLELREKNDSLREESRRIKEETILLLEEASSLRVESDTYRKKASTAEDAVRKARLAQEAAEEELLALKEKGVMFAPENDEALEKEYEKLKDELMSVLEQKNDLQDENEKLNSRIEKLEEQIKEIRAKGEGGLTAAAEMIQEISDMEDRLKEAAAEKTKLAQEKQAAENEAERMKGQLSEAEAQKEKLIEDALALEKVIADFEGSKARGENEGRADELAALQKEIDALKGRVDEAQANEARLAKDKEALQAELLAAKETVKLNTPMLESIGSVEAGGMDLGRIFLQTTKDAGADDLDMLGRLMQAMNKDVIKASDKKMLMDILKRFVK
ncbi:MAG: helix-turn-helix domain-containing protein [Clostridiales bacterium]|nr:helix-turn-helix domain-containing protein [Clostridiales bacterium]